MSRGGAAAPAARTDWGFVHQNPRDGLRMDVTRRRQRRRAADGASARATTGSIRAAALDWLGRVEIDADRIDDLPATFSGGMQQRLQIARNLVTRPRLVFMDEPTGGLDVSVQARLLDLLRGLVRELGLAAIVVTHDLAVARLLAHRLMVMRRGGVVETGLTDQVLDDPQHPYTQLLVSSVLARHDRRPATPDPRSLRKTFTLHCQGGARAAGAARRDLSVSAGECVVLADASGAGKSTLLRCVYGNYRPQAGRILVRHGGERSTW